MAQTVAVKMLYENIMFIFYRCYITENSMIINRQLFGNMEKEIHGLIFGTVRFGNFC
jgi:hypothetical protein